MKNSFAKGIFVLFILIIVLLFFICYITIKPMQVTFSKPFFNHVTEIAVDDHCIYTLDDTFNYICKYTDAGEFRFAISFSSMGANYIYINEDGFLCRYDLKQSIEYVYDEDGSQIQSNSLAYQDFKNIRDTQPITEINTDEKTYEYHNRTVFNSVIEIIDSSEESGISIVVESFAFHMVWIILIVSWLVGFVFFAWQIYRFILNKK